MKNWLFYSLTNGYRVPCTFRFLCIKNHMFKYVLSVCYVMITTCSIFCTLAVFNKIEYSPPPLGFVFCMDFTFSRSPRFRRTTASKLHRLPVVGFRVLFLNKFYLTFYHNWIQLMDIYIINRHREKKIIYLEQLLIVYNKYTRMMST